MDIICIHDIHHMTIQGATSNSKVTYLISLSLILFFEIQVNRAHDIIFKFELLQNYLSNIQVRFYAMGLPFFCFNDVQSNLIH